MDEDVDTLTCGLTLLVNLGKVLLQNAKQEAAGRTEPGKKAFKVFSC